MTDKEFKKRMLSLKTTDTKEDLELKERNRIRKELLESKEDPETLMAVCIEEMAELAKELTKAMRKKENVTALWQEVCHVQWTVWCIQELFGISNRQLAKGIQASIRP